MEQSPDGEISSLRAYVGAVTRKIALHKYRDRSKGAAVALDELYGELCTGISAEDEAVSRETANVINALLRSLPQKQRVIFVARYYSGLEASDIAARVGVSVSAVHKSLAKTRKQLKKQLERNGIEL